MPLPALIFKCIAGYFHLIYRHIHNSSDWDTASSKGNIIAVHTDNTPGQAHLD